MIIFNQDLGVLSTGPLRAHYYAVNGAKLDDNCPGKAPWKRPPAEAYIWVRGPSDARGAMR